MNTCRGRCRYGKQDAVLKSLQLPELGARAHGGSWQAAGSRQSLRRNQVPSSYGNSRTQGRGMARR